MSPEEDNFRFASGHGECVPVELTDMLGDFQTAGPGVSSLVSRARLPVGRGRMQRSGVISVFPSRFVGRENGDQVHLSLFPSVFLSSLTMAFSRIPVGSFTDR